MELPVFFVPFVRSRGVMALCGVGILYETFRFDAFFRWHSTWAPTMSLPDTIGDAIFRYRELGNVIDTSNCCGELAQPTAVSNYMGRSSLTGQFYCLGRVACRSITNAVTIWVMG